MREFYGSLKTNVSPINEFLETRKGNNESKYKEVAHKYRNMANTAMGFLASLNYTVDPKTNNIRELSEDEIENLKKKKKRNQGPQL